MTSGPLDSEADGLSAHTEVRGPVRNATPPETLVSGAVGDRCVSCGSPLSSDQRYCVICGERRGAPRFSLPPAAPEAQPATAVATRPPAGGGGRFSAGTTLIAGVATLLLALLVGVLIGHNTAGSGTQTVNPAPVRIINNGGGSSSSGGSSSGGGSATTPATSKGSPSKSTAKLKPKKVAPKQTAKAQSGAAAKVLGGKTPPATVTVGSTGTGKGYSKKTHKFNGSFFGQ